ncbi:MAG: LysE family transporter [Candidatus Eisenbacteria bacterium]
MNFGAFLITAILISLSGVMAPGPLTVVVVGKGAKSPRAGALIALGHGAIEFPLMALIVLGLGPFFQHKAFATSVGLAGGGVLLWMAAGLLLSLRRGSAEGAGPERMHGASPFMAGVLMTGGNPYFIIWWATVGATLVFRAWSYGVWQFAVFAVIHWSLDLIWYFFLSSAAFKGTKLLGDRFLKGISLLAGLMLLYFGVRFLSDALVNLL